MKSSLGPRNLHCICLLSLRGRIRVTTTPDVPKTQGRVREPNKTGRAITPRCRFNLKCRRVIVKTGKLGGSILGNASLRKVGQGRWGVMELRNLAPLITGLPSVSALLSHCLGQLVGSMVSGQMLNFTTQKLTLYHLHSLQSEILEAVLMATIHVLVCL